MSSDYANTAYMTVGEVAVKTGLTVRTIQYYDQQGLLAPSAKGNRNLRLYTKEDMERLYRILTYKALGLSIKDIRQRLAEEQQPAQIIGRLQEKIMLEEKELMDKVKRYGALKNLESYMLNNEISKWQDLSELIDYLQVKWSMIWELNLDGKWEKVLKQPENAAIRSLLPYYTLLTETVRLMRNDCPPDSEEAMDIMKRFGELAPEEQNDALLYVDPEIMNLWRDDYMGLWKDIKEYMKAANEHYIKREKESEL